MRRVFVPFLITIAFMSCMPKTGSTQNDVVRDCSMIIIDCPVSVKAGNTVLIKAVLYDSDNQRIENTRNIRPNWMIDNNNVLLIKEINGDECRIKALKPGTCQIKVMQDNAVATTEIVVGSQ